MAAVPVPGMVRAASAGGFFVASRTVAGGWWFVENGECSCPARKPRCFHVQQVDRFVSMLEELHKPRPSAPANVSAMVD